MDRLDRRAVLERTAKLATVGALGSAAGCLEGDIPEGVGDLAASETAAGAGTSTDDRPFSPGDWLPAPAIISEGGHYAFGVLRPAALTPDVDALGRAYYEELIAMQGALDLVEVAPERVNTHVATAAASVIDGSVPPDAVRTALQDGGFERSGAHGGFDVWTPTDDADVDGLAVALGGGPVVVGRDTRMTDPTRSVETAIDAGVGAAERFGAVDEAAARLTDRIAGGDIAMAVTRDPPGEPDPEEGQFAGNTGLGYAVSVDGDLADLAYHLVFDSAGDADTGTVQQWLDAAAAGSPAARLDDREVTADGAAVVVTGTLPTDDLSETTVGGIFVSSGSDSDGAIHAGVDVSADSRARSVTVTWTSDGNADYLRARFTPPQGNHVEKRIEGVGDAVTYDAGDSDTVWIEVSGHVDDREAVLTNERVDF